MEELRRYLGARFDPARAAAPQAALAEDWRAASPEGEPEVLAFYRGAEGYLYDLTVWHQMPERRDWTEALVRYAREQGVRTVLDYGCGIGEDGLALLAAGCEVTFADLGCPALEYLRWRLADRGLRAEVRALEDGTDLVGGWDLGLCLDVLEHLSRPQPVLTWLAEACEHLAVTWPGPTSAHPMHLSRGYPSVVLPGLDFARTAEVPPIWRRRWSAV